jgi:hypothetical protein
MLGKRPWQPNCQANAGYGEATDSLGKSESSMAAMALLISSDDLSTTAGSSSA